MNNSRPAVVIVNTDHPHYPEWGWWTGEVISVFGQTMGKIRLANCEHGVGACYVSPKDVESIKAPERSM